MISMYRHLLCSFFLTYSYIVIQEYTINQSMMAKECDIYSSQPLGRDDYLPHKVLAHPLPVITVLVVLTSSARGDIAID